MLGECDSNRGPLLLEATALPKCHNKSLFLDAVLRNEHIMGAYSHA